jgi:hypothetical protein
MSGKFQCLCSIHPKCLVQAKVIHPNDQAKIETVKAQWHLLMNPSCRKQILGQTWVLRCEIRFKIHKFQLEAALGAKFESLFGKMMINVKYFVFFCNLVNILHVGPATHHAESSDKSQDSNPGFPLNRKRHGTDSARNIAVCYLVCVCIYFRKVGAL